MKKILVRKHTDFKMKIDSNFNLVFLDMFTGEEYSYPIILEKNITIDIPDVYYDLIDFMNKRKPYLEGENINIFLNIIKMEITPFIWVLMKNAKIDVFFSKDSLYVVDFKTNKYIVFNNRNMSVKIFDKIYRNQIKASYSTYNDCKEELYTYVRNRIQNSIGHNEFVNNQMKDFKFIQNQMEKEFLKQQNFDIKKALFLYEELIRIKENYLCENHYLLPQNVIDEIATTVEQIRILLSNPPKYNTNTI